MRIAILTSARSGSTSLFRLIEEHLDSSNYVLISEPFNNHYWKVTGKSFDYTYFENKNNVLIKTFIGNSQIPKSFTNNVNKYWDWFFQYFEKIIILDRQNKQLQSESLVYHLKKKYLKNWHQKDYYDLTDIKPEDIKKTKKILIGDSEKMHLISKRGYPIFYYEDIFIKKNKKIINDLFNYIEVALSEAMYQKYVFNDTFKVRLNEKPNYIKSLI